MEDLDQRAHFEQAVLPHLTSAYNLARWLVRNEYDAEDLVQEGCLRALRSFDSFRGGDTRAWLLAIVRNACYTWLRQKRAQDRTTEFDEDIHSTERPSRDPEALLLDRADSRLLQDALEKLSPDLREAIVLRELEEMSYKQIAEICGIPMGTVMSRLARARQRLERHLVAVSARSAP